MIDHMGFTAADMEASKAFYSACVAPLGLRLLEDNAREDGARWLVFGQGDDDPFFVVSNGPNSFWTDDHAPGKSPIHIAFVAPTREAVDAFYAAGLASGGRDNGAPGPRGERYYAAYLIDPDGNNVEAGTRG